MQRKGNRAEKNVNAVEADEWMRIRDIEMIGNKKYKVVVHVTPNIHVERVVGRRVCTITDDKSEH